jgi:hypothetical protein
VVIGIAAVAAILLFIIIVKDEHRRYVLGKERERIAGILASDRNRYGHVRVIAIKTFANGLEGTVSSSSDLNALYAQLDAADIHNTVRNVQVAPK